MRGPPVALAAALLTACSEPSRPATETASPHPPPSAAPAPSAAPPPSFPELPLTPEAAEALIARETQRPTPAAPALDAPAILAAIADRPAAVVAGDGAVARWIQGFLDRAGGEDAYVLAGVWHDAPGQIDAFRRLVGPGGLRGLTAVAVELFRARGAWSGVPLEAQSGDSAEIDAYVRRGDLAAFAALARSHRDADYVAWKLGYEPTVLDLLITARAHQNLPFAGCDMPRALQERSGAPAGEPRNRLREIHCLRSLPPARPRRAALLWGEAHLRPEGLRRFLPTRAAALALHLVGRRLEAGPLEAALGKELAVAEPALVPLGADEAVLLLPDEAIGARVDRVLVTAEAGEALMTGVVARLENPGEIVLDGRAASVGPAGTTLAPGEGEHTYVLHAGGRWAVGALRLAAGHRVELGFDARPKIVSYVERAPR